MSMKKFFYRVEKGDTIFLISKKFRVPPTLLVFDNNLKSDVLAGDLLVIKVKEGKSYSVKALETIKEIAEKFNKREEDILEYNKTPILYFGQDILIP